MRTAAATITRGMNANRVQDGAMAQLAGPEFAGASGFQDVRWAKVEALRIQIAAGTYFVPAEAIAEKLVRRMTHARHRIV